MQKKKTAGFTLIELMVVVAIIAILAVLGVTSFSSAMKRARNATVQSDVNTMAKALETCFDPLKGTYSVASGTTYTAAKSALEASGCLKANSIGNTDDKFNLNVKGTTGTTIQTFVLCGTLEAVGVNASGVGNSVDKNGTACGSATNCIYFCIQNMQ
ncbi:MAG: prepilin-type N-terminal cleavage/methylation domain-containing protein [bacterium]|nr:prepilin-type N-terminal cleavage/methylation domain-containing protein [bacterium]